MNDIVGLKFLLNYGAWFATPILYDDAKDIMRKWASGEYAIKGVTTISNNSPLHGQEKDVWALSIADIRGMHTFVWAEAQQQPAQLFPQPQPTPQPRSNWPPRNYGGLSGGR